MTWLEQADQLIAGAEKARKAGDLVAMVALLTVASQCLQIAKNLAAAEAERKRKP